MNILTITSCKRPLHFRKTITSLRKHCTDLHLIDLIKWYDDNSSTSDRVEMLKILLECFENKKIISTYFSNESFNTRKRHREVMNVWKNDLSIMSVDYVFHTEDDFEYIADFSISECVGFLQKQDDVALIGLSQEKRELPVELGRLNIQGNFWEWYYDKNKPLCDGLFLDTVIMNKHPNTRYWCQYINWPYFGFRPGIHDVKKLEKLDKFHDVDGSFELEFATRFAKLYKSFSYVNEICRHIGDINAYDLNESLR